MHHHYYKPNTTNFDFCHSIYYELRISLLNIPYHLKLKDYKINFGSTCTIIINLHDNNRCNVFPRKKCGWYVSNQKGLGKGNGCPLALHLKKFVVFKIISFLVAFMFVVG